MYKGTRRSTICDGKMLEITHVPTAGNLLSGLWYIHSEKYSMGQKQGYSCEYSTQSVFLHFYLLIIGLFSLWKTVTLRSPHPV